MLFGPVFHSELIMTARRKRYYVARVAYGLLLLFSLWQQYKTWGEQEQFRSRYWGQPFDPTESFKAMARFAESAFVAFAWAQGVAILCLVPGLLAGVIADEHQRKTLHYLLGSRLTSTGIILGKLGARLLHVGVVLLIGVPIVCLVALFGGLDPREVAYVYAGTFSMTLFAAGLSMLVSVVARRPKGAIIMAYTLVAAWVFVPPFISSIYTYIEFTPLAWIGPINDLASAINPLQAWRLVTEQSFVNEINARNARYRWAMVGGGAALGPNVLFRFLMMAALQTGLGVLFLILCIIGLRPLRGGGGRWERRRTVWFPTLREFSARVRRHPECGDDPMVWKERFTAGGGGLGWLSSRPVVLAVALVMGAYLLEVARPALNEFLAGSGFSSSAGSHRLYLNGVLRPLSGLLELIMILAVASASAVSVTSEREADTWISLNTTLLTGPEIIRGKIRGAVWSARRIVWVMAATWFLGVASGAVHPLGALAAALALGAFAWFTAALGVYISLRARNSTRALAATLLWLLLFNGAYLAVLAPWGEPPPLMVAGVTPFVQAASLASYEDIHLLEAGAGGLGILAMYLTSVSGYGFAALLLTGAGCEACDKVVDRPRRAG